MKSIDALHKDAPLTDIHVHPSLKAWLFRRNLWRHYSSGKGVNPFSSRSDFKSVKKGGIRVMWTAHYLPERELFRQCWIAKTATKVLVPKSGRLFKGGQFDRLNEMIDAMEREINRRPEAVELARSAAHVKAVTAAGKIAVVHTVEGAHPLEGDPDNVDKLAKRGVAMITLAHFFKNDMVRQVEGIPKEMFVRKICKWDFSPRQGVLSDYGKAVLRKMEENKMIVDLTHCTIESRSAVLSEMASDRPVVMSHSGVNALTKGFRNPTDNEIKEIASRGGAIGIIFMTHWLADHPAKDGLDLIWKNMEHVRNVTGSWDHVAIGSDFDGFTDPTDDLNDASEMPKLTELLQQKGLSDSDIEKVLGRNAQRVLDLGWV